MKAIFRTDASAAAGGGHVIRCLALAQALSEIGCLCEFACTEETSAVVPALSQSKYKVHHLKNSEYADPGALSKKLGGTCDWLIIDHYQLGADYESHCRSFAKAIATIDDLRRQHDCDILIDQTAGTLRQHYEDLVPAPARLLTGSHYALLRPPFWALRETSLLKGQQERINNVFVSVGTVDQQDLCSKILDACAMIDSDFSMDIVIGSTSANLKKLQTRARGAHRRIAVHTDLDAHAVARLIGQSELAIGSGGTISWERCCLGVPTIMILSAENQKHVANHLQELGAVAYLGTSADVTARQIADTIIELGQDAEYRRQMSLRAASICDGRGAARVARSLLPLLSKDGSRVEIRPVSMSDADLLLIWRSHPLIYKNSRNQSAPSESEHREFLERKLSDPYCHFNIITHNGLPSGVLRLDMIREKERLARTSSASAWRPQYEVSILVDPERQKLGIAQCALQLASELVPHAVLLAYIREGNGASEKLFSNAGYVHDGKWFVRPPLSLSNSRETDSQTILKTFQ